MKKPDVSIIVSVLNRRNEMEICVKSLVLQNHPNYEIIIIDGGSRDGTLEMLKTYEKKYKNKLRIFVDKRPNRNLARNLGIENASGKILAFTDSDCIPEKYWLSEIIKPLKRKEVGGVIGTTLADRKGLFWYHMENKYLQFIGHNNAYRSDLIKKLNGFDPRFKIAKEDTDLSFRVIENGYEVVYQPSAKLIHTSRRVSVFRRIKNQRTFIYDGLLRSKHPTLYGKYMGYSDMKNCGIATVVFLFAVGSLLIFPIAAFSISLIYAFIAVSKLVKGGGSIKENLTFLAFAWLIPIFRFLQFLRGFIIFRNKI